MISNDSLDLINIPDGEIYSHNHLKWVTLKIKNGQQIAW